MALGLEHRYQRCGECSNCLKSWSSFPDYTLDELQLWGGHEFACLVGQTVFAVCNNVQCGFMIDGYDVAGCSRCGGAVRIVDVKNKRIWQWEYSR